MKTTTLFTVLTTSAAMAGSVSAAAIVNGTTIGVDFGGGMENNFNSVTGDGTLSSITDTTGAVLTGVSFTNTGILASNGQADGNLAGQPSQFVTSHLTDWSLSNTGVTWTMTFAGLDDAFIYDLVIGAADGASNFDVDTTFTAGGLELTNEGNVGATAFVTFLGLETDGFGNLEFTAQNAPSSVFGGVSALELTAVPEPHGVRDRTAGPRRAVDASTQS